MCRVHYRQGATSVPLILDCDAVERRNFEIFFLFSLLMDKMGVSCRKRPWNGIENEVSNSTVWRLESAERCLFRQVEAFGDQEAKLENGFLKENVLDHISSSEYGIGQFTPAPPFFKFKTAQDKQVANPGGFSCPGLSTSFRACLFPYQFFGIYK